jgi:hypothetical protein
MRAGGRRQSTERTSGRKGQATPGSGAHDRAVLAWDGHRLQSSWAGWPCPPLQVLQSFRAIRKLTENPAFPKHEVWQNGFAVPLQSDFILVPASRFSWDHGIPIASGVHTAGAHFQLRRQTAMLPAAPSEEEANVLNDTKCFRICEEEISFY